MNNRLAILAVTNSPIFSAIVYCHEWSLEHGQPVTSLEPLATSGVQAMSSILGVPASTVEHIVDLEISCLYASDIDTNTTVKQYGDYDTETLAVTNSVYWPGVKIGATLMDAHFTNISMRALAEERELDFEVVRQVAVSRLKYQHHIAMHYPYGC